MSKAERKLYVTSKDQRKLVVKVIALVSKPHQFKPIFEQLKARNILVFAPQSFETAVKILESGAVDYCLLSVDHDQLDIYSLPQKIENDYNIPVIAISELRDKQSMWRLTKVKVKNILYSKATAPSITARVELMKKIALANKASKDLEAHRALLLGGKKREGGSRASRALKKLKDRFVEEPKKKQKTSLFAPWKAPIGTVTLADAKYTFLRHSGEETPTEIRKNRKEFVELFGASLDDSQTKVENYYGLGNGEVSVEDTAENANYRIDEESKESFGETVEGFGSEAIASEDVQKVILHCLRTVLSEFCNPNEFSKEANEFSNSMVISIKSKSLIGTFIIAEQFTKSNLNELQTQLYKYLRNFGFDWSQQEVAVQILNDLKVPAEVLNSGVYASGVDDGSEMAISYYQEAIEIPDLPMPEDIKYYFDPKFLVKKTDINFDIYLHLKVNSKDLHYIKAGTQITEKQIEKLKLGGAVPWVPRQQLSNLTEYILLQRLLRMINGEDSQEMQDVEELLKIS